MSRLDRLSRRGVLTIVAKDGNCKVRFESLAPFFGYASCSTDIADLYEHCHLGASSWQGEGPNLDELLDECEDATRPRTRDVDDLRWEIANRRNSRTHGPPLPDFRRSGRHLDLRWHPGHELWLRTSDHKYEYLDGYLRDLETERKTIADQAASDAWRAQRERDRVRRVLS